MKQVEVKKITLEQAVAEWKECKIKYCEMPFDCGGDSMNDYSFKFYDDKGEITNDLLDSFFEDEVFRKVSFYEASDGYYQGENGIVTIELDVDEFTYLKDAQAEFNESFTGLLKLKLKKAEAEFIKKNVERIMGGEDSGEANIVFKHDLILSDEEEKMIEKLETLIHSEAEDFTPPDAEGSKMDWFTYNTNEDDDELTIDEKNNLHIEVSRTYAIYRDSND